MSSSWWSYLVSDLCLGKVVITQLWSPLIWNCWGKCLLGQEASGSISAVFWEVTKRCGCPVHISTLVDYQKLCRTLSRDLRKPAGSCEARIHHPVFIVQYTLEFTPPEKPLADNTDFRTLFISSFQKISSLYTKNVCIALQLQRADTSGIELGIRA